MMSLLLVHTLSAFQFPKLFGGINQQNKNNKIPILSSAAKLQQQVTTKQTNRSDLSEPLIDYYP